MSVIKNGAPMTIHLGANDMSNREIPVTRDPLPTHLPKLYIYARRGPLRPGPTEPNKLYHLFGEDTFDEGGEYFNHQTRYLRDIAGMANTIIPERVIPEDAGIRSNIVVYMDVLETEVPNYVRNSFGDIVIDADTNTYKVDDTTPTIPGFKIKFIAEPKDVDEDLGLATTKPGTMSDGSGNTSTMYPFMEHKAKYHGEYYNNIGYGIESVFGDDLDTTIVDEIKALPYMFKLYTRPNKKSSPQVFANLFKEPETAVTFKKNAKNPRTRQRFDVEAVFQTKFFNESDPLYALKYNDYEGMYVYRDYFEQVLTNIMNTEKEHINATMKTWDDGEQSDSLSWFDFTTDDNEDLMEEIHVINPFTCKSSKNVPFFSVMIESSAPSLTGEQKEINFSANTPVFLDGGSDGTLSVENYEKEVKKRLKEYSDQDAKVNNYALNPESFFYDSGFGLETKEAFANTIAVRKDTAVVLSTHTADLGEKYLPLSDERAIAVALKTRFKLSPESTYFGTPVARALVVPGTGLMVDGSTLDRIPLTYSLALKAARMMGASNGKWKEDYIFDKQNNNKITELKDVQPEYIPKTIKNVIWRDGMMWADPDDRREHFFSSTQTIYDEETSVLNNFFSVAALCDITKVANATWRAYSGSLRYTPDQFKDEVENFYKERTKRERYAGMFTVIPEVVITDEDEARGYSWRLVTKLYGNVSKTVMVHESQIFRASDLGGE